MFQYHLNKNDENIFGRNFSLLMKLTAKADPDQSRFGVITASRLEDAFFQHKGTEKRNMIVHFSDDPEFNKYIRLSYVGNYYFGFRINEMNFIKTFVAKERGKRNFSANKFLYSYMMKNYFQNKWFGTNNQMYIETRFKDHRKIHDESILIDKVKSDLLIDTLKEFMKFKIDTEKDQFELTRFFLKLKKEI